MVTKTCSVCNEEKDINNFKNKNELSKYFNECIICFNARVRKYKLKYSRSENGKSKKEKYRKENKAYLHEKDIEYRERNKVQITEKNKERARIKRETKSKTKIQPDFIVCSKCKEEKNKIFFNLVSSNSDKRRPECKECNKKRYNEYKNTDGAKEKREIYYKNNKQRLKCYVKAYNNKDEVKLRNAIKAEKARNKSPKETIATRTIANALSRGDFSKPIACPLCKSKDNKIQGHHFNYDFPLYVLWCCTECHHKIHHGKSISVS